MSMFWDQRYAGADYKYGTEPNNFLRAQAQRLPALSRVLVPGDGEGRNGVWLAAQGHQVLAVDSSAVGLAKAQDLAAARGVALQTKQVDLTRWVPAVNSVDAVVLVFVHLPSAWRSTVHRNLAKALAPGGCLLLECFHPRQLGRSSGGPRDIDMLTSVAQLRADFYGLLDELLGWEGEVELSEGAGHSGLGVVTRWIGQRPQPAVGRGRGRGPGRPTGA